MSGRMWKLLSAYKINVSFVPSDHNVTSKEKLQDLPSRVVTEHRSNMPFPCYISN